MKGLFKSLSLAPRSIRHKLTVAFALMSVIPMLVCGYLLIYYVFPILKTLGGISLLFTFTILLMVSGFYLAKKIIYPVIEISLHAKGIVVGRLGKELDITGEDEISQLGGSLNQLSARLKENMGELHSYGEKIKQINMEINKKVFALSSLLQISNLITTTCNLDEVLQLVAEKLSQLEAQGPTFLMLLEKESRQLSMRVQTNMQSEEARQIRIKIGQGLLGKVFSTTRPLIVDTQRKSAVDKELQKILPTRNIAVLPITSSGKVIGILGTGNNIEPFFFSDDEIELIGVFTKQIAVAIENDTLLRKAEELNTRDELTGLYNESYIRSRLDEEIKRAVSYQRPCSFIILEINNFRQYRDTLGEIVAERTLKKIAQTLKVGTTEIDKVARFSDHQFAVILPEKNKRQCLNLAENITKEIERFALQQKQDEPSAVVLTFNAGISATPIDGLTSVELINRALSYIAKAKGEGTNKIVMS